MKVFKDILLKEPLLKLVSLLAGFLLWALVNIAQRVQTTLEKQIELIGTNKELSYRLNPKNATIKLGIASGIDSKRLLKELKTFVDVSGLSEGEYNLRVEVRGTTPILVKVIGIEPEFVKVKVIKAPEGGKRF
ncbi:MAG: hypothetical protein RMJ32_00710 [Aquificaceae bacterium]|nr:hypothetical protein [Aquificaceae bacterium]